MLHIKAQMAGHVFGGGNDIYMTADENAKKGKNSYRANSARSSKRADYGRYVLNDTPEDQGQNGLQAIFVVKHGSDVANKLHLPQL